MKRKSPLFLLCIILNTSLQELYAQQPVISSFSPTNGYIGSLITITGSKLSSPTSVSIGGVNAIIITAENTQIVGMVMPGAVTSAISVTTAGGTSLGNSNLIINANQPPIKQFAGKLDDADNQNGLHPGEEGFSVAMSADGTTAVAGGDFDNGDAGAVWVYIRTNNKWIQQAKLTGSGAVGTSPSQGFSAAISADGNTIIEGGVGDNGFTGAVWFFVRNKNGVWAQQGNKLVGSNSIITNRTTPEQGYSVSISADGNTAIIGGRRDNNYIGAAWIFTRSNNVWTEQQKIIPTGYISYANHQGTQLYLGVDMGTSVAMSADGNTALIGGPADNNDTGAVWVYTRNGNTWSQQGNKLVGTGSMAAFNAGIQQGTSVAISADGNTLIEGGPFDTDSTTGNIINTYTNGAVWIFTRNGNLWGQQGNKLFATDAGFSAEQGWSVSISADGNTAMVGAPTDSVYTGGFWIYTRHNNVWKQASNRILGTGYVGAAKEGWSSSISADGNTAIIGGPEDYYQEQGAAWIFGDTGNIVLPVTFANFKAYFFDKGIQTEWTGFEEINISSYDVERSANGYAFSKLATVEAKTNTALQNNYAWFDASPFSGNSFYRVKSVSKDKGTQYSAIIKVNISNTQGGIQVYPNPVYENKINLRLNNVIAGNYTISVYSTNGKIQYRQAFKHAGGSSFVAIPLGNAAPGIYKIVMKNDNNCYQATAVLQ